MPLPTTSRPIKVSWDASKTKCLITEYQKYEYLYNSQHSLYRNRIIRENTIGHIAKTLQHLWSGSDVTCTGDDIKRKLNGLRSQYLFERHKVEKSRQEGFNYVPTIYWFPMLQFLDDVILKTKTTTEPSCEIPPSSIQLVQPESFQIVKEDIKSPSPQSFASSSSDLEILDTFIDIPNFLEVVNSPPSNCSENASQTNKRPKIDDKLIITEVVDINNHAAATKIQHLSKAEISDHLETFGKFIVDELRGIYLSSNEVLLRKTKRQMQQVLIDAWAKIDMEESRYPVSSSSSVTNIK